MHRFPKGEGSAVWREDDICAGLHVRGVPNTSPADPGCAAGHALQPLRKKKTKSGPGGADDQERSRPDVKAQGGCGAPVRDNQVVRRSVLLLVQGEGKGERRNSVKLSHL